MSSHGGLSPLTLKVPLPLPRPSANLGPPFMNFGMISSPSSLSSSVIGRSQALKVHSQAEKRRRERINTHLSTLRRMVPSDATTKMDKAALLGAVIDHVKDLQRKAVDVGKGSSIPTEANEVIVESRSQQTVDTTSENKNKDFCIKASVCCEDRPDLFMSLMKAFHGLRLRAVRADITSLGGRVQSVFILCGEEQHMGNGNVVSLSSLKESVEDALARIASFDVAAMDGSSSKRQRLLQSRYSSAYM